jgi:hypothetical protein
VATTPDVVRMRVEGLGFIVTSDHYSAHARVRLQLRDNSEVAFSVSGKADRIEKDLEPNTDGRSIAYGGVECTVIQRNVTSVHNCRGTGGQRTCEVGVDFSGEKHSYLVSVSIRPISPVGVVRLNH